MGLVSHFGIFLFMYVQYIPSSAMVTSGSSNTTTDVHGRSTDQNTTFEDYRGWEIIEYKGDDSIFNTTESVIILIEGYLKLPCCDTSAIYDIDLQMIPKDWVCPMNGQSLENLSKAECCDYWHSYVLNWPTYNLLELSAKAFACQPQIEVSWWASWGQKSMVTWLFVQWIVNAYNEKSKLSINDSLWG